MGDPHRKSALPGFAFYIYALLGVIIFSILGVPFIRKHTGDWEVTYLLSARHLWAGQSMYHNGDGYIYPPFPALFALLFAYLPGVLPKLAWYGVTVFCFVVVCRYVWKLAGGYIESARGDHTPVARVTLTHILFVLSILPGVTYAFNCISHSQTDILIGCAIITGCVALTRGRPLLAATLYGFAAAMKGPALIWCPYLIARRKPLAAFWMLLFFIGLNLAPNLMRPASHPRLLLVDWAHDYLLPKKTANVYPDVWFSESNQSLLGSITRWTTTRWQWEGKSYRQRIPLDHPAGPKLVKIITLSAYGVLALFLATALGWWPAKLNLSRGTVRPALEFSMVIILMLVFSPMAAKAQWGVLMLPGFCLARLCIIRRELIVIACFTTGWLAWIASQNFLGPNAVFVGLWYGAVLINALLWFAGCGYVLMRSRGRGVED